MSDDFNLNTLLSTFLDDYHEINSEIDVPSLSQSQVDAHVNRIISSLTTLTEEIVDAIAESSDAITRDDVFDPLMGLLK
jgi:hypothetical protein